jgi:hypothetical protein
MKHRPSFVHPHSVTCKGLGAVRERMLGCPNASEAAGETRALEGLVRILSSAFCFQASALILRPRDLFSGYARDTTTSPSIEASQYAQL